jgi:hypothetical protein
MSPEYLAAWEDMAHLPALFGLKHVLATMSDLIGLPSDQLRFVITLLLNIPIGWAFQSISGATNKHITSLVLGILSTYFIVGIASLNVFFSSAVVYLLTYFLMPSSAHLKKIEDAEELKKAKEVLKAQRQRVGSIVFAFSMGYMCLLHIYRLYVDYLGYKIDASAPQMMLTLKLVSYGWQRVDGEILNDGDRLDDLDREEEYRTSKAIRATPSPLAFFAYVYHYASVIAGPSVDYHEYADYVDGSLWTKHGLKQLPFTVKPALYKLLCAFLAYPGLLLANAFPVMGYASSAEFYSHSLLYRVAYVTFFNGFARYKYYFAWYLAEAGCVASGIALSGHDQKTGVTEWEGCNNCRAFMVETCTSTSDLINNWNIRVSMWLKHMIYMRVQMPDALHGKISPRTFANLVTKFTSAFWHGFYPGYYIFFFQIWFIQTFETKIRGLLLPLFSVPNPARPRWPTLQYPRAYVYNVVMNCFTLWSLNWLGASFVMLEFWPSIRLLVDSYAMYHVIGIFALVVVPKLFKKKRSGTDKPVTAASAAQCAVDAVTADVAVVTSPKKSQKME